MKKISTDKKGFTLAELLVSITVIGVVSTWSLASFHKYGRQGDVDMSAQRLASDVRLIQGYAFGLKEYNNTRPSGGWGLYFNKIYPDNWGYTMYADISDGAGGPPNHRRDNDEDHKTINLGKVDIKEIEIDGVSVDEMTVTAEPPDPQTWICEVGGECSTTTSAMIILDSGGETARVDLNTFGLVDIE